MPAPTDTLVQTLAQTLTAYMPAHYATLAALGIAALGVALFLATIAALVALHHRQKAASRRRRYDAELAANRRTPHRPADWGHYR